MHTVRSLPTHRWLPTRNYMCSGILRMHPASGSYVGPYKRYPARPFTPAEQEFNTQMSKKRIAVEWSFGEILQRWHFVICI
jgi:hypothetical protein